jgi:hypothetical protein
MNIFAQCQGKSVVIVLLYYHDIANLTYGANALRLELVQISGNLGNC